MLVRILAMALAIVLFGTTANAEPPATSPDGIELVDVDAAVPTPVVTIVEPVRQLIVPTPPPLASLSPRLHVSSLFRPPRV